MSISLARPALKLQILAGETPPWVLEHIRSSYIIAVALSTPPWVDRKALRAIQQRARDRPGHAPARVRPDRAVEPADHHGSGERREE